MPFQSLTTFLMVAVVAILQLGTIVHAIAIPSDNIPPTLDNRAANPFPNVDFDTRTITTPTSPNPATDILAKRWLQMECPGGYPYCSKKRIEEGIRYLYGVPGKPKNGPYSGSGQYANCGRVSCSYNSAIWWCNMNSYTLELHSYRQIADAAKQVVEICNTGNDVAGRVKMEGNWAVIVAKASC